MGDGLMQYHLSLGYGEVTNDFLHGHELGHVLEYTAVYYDVGEDIEALNDWLNNSTPEEDQYIELLADAYAGYFLSHELGRNLNNDLLMQAAWASFSIGDCGI